MKNLEMYGVQEMNAIELKNTDGGWLIPFIVGAIVGGLIYDGVKALTAAYVDTYCEMADEGRLNNACYPIIP